MRNSVKLSEDSKQIIASKIPALIPDGEHLDIGFPQGRYLELEGFPDADTISYLNSLNDLSKPIEFEPSTLTVKDSLGNDISLFLVEYNFFRPRQNALKVYIKVYCNNPMPTHSANPQPAFVPHPGKILERELEARGWPTRYLRALEARSDVPFDCVAYFDAIIAGERSIDETAAKILAHRLGTSEQFWLNLQSNYDHFIANKSA